MEQALSGAFTKETGAFTGDVTVIKEVPLDDEFEEEEETAVLNPRVVEEDPLRCSTVKDDPSTSTASSSVLPVVMDCCAGPIQVKQERLDDVNMEVVENGVSGELPYFSADRLAIKEEPALETVSFTRFTVEMARSAARATNVEGLLDDVIVGEYETDVSPSVVGDSSGNCLHIKEEPISQVAAGTTECSPTKEGFVCDIKAQIRSNMNKLFSKTQKDPDLILSGRSSKPLPITNTIDENESSVMLSCYMCDYSSDCKRKLRRHMRQHTGYHVCLDCGYKCDRASDMNKHERFHSGEKPYGCEVCQYRTNVASNMKKHLRIHTGEKPYACEVCDYRCTQSGSLKKHMLTHTGEEPYSCEFCVYRSKQAGGLLEHMRIHTGEKPFVCTVCDHKFARAGNLKDHMKTHTGEKPFVCAVCNLRFSRSTHLKRHGRIHLRQGHEAV